jgi:hypothetical protein
MLVFTGTKMLASNWIQISPGVSLLVIGVMLLGTIAASTLLPQQQSTSST